MKTPDSTQDKITTVNAFINGRLNKFAKVTDYSPMVTYLNGNHIQVLYERLPKTTIIENVLVLGKDGSRQYKDLAYYGNGDAEMYLEWLISVVQGYEESSDEIKNKAYDQLCRFILILTDVTQWKDGYVLAKPYDWVTRLEDFEADIAGMIENEVKETAKELETYQYTISGYAKKLDELSEIIENNVDTLSGKAIDLTELGEKLTVTNEKQMSEIAKMLELITTWMEKYAPVMDRIQQDYKKLNPTKVKKQ